MPPSTRIYFAWVHTALRSSRAGKDISTGVLLVQLWRDNAGELSGLSLRLDKNKTSYCLGSHSKDYQPYARQGDRDCIEGGGGGFPFGYYLI